MGRPLAEGVLGHTTGWRNVDRASWCLAASVHCKAVGLRVLVRVPRGNPAKVVSSDAIKHCPCGAVPVLNGDGCQLHSQFVAGACRMFGEHLSMGHGKLLVMMLTVIIVVLMIIVMMTMIMCRPHLVVCGGLTMGMVMVMIMMMSSSWSYINN